jgi:nucleoside-diphosphate-sugar epimerase
LSKTIGVLGCGWLGLPLALALIEEGYNVRGTSTTASKIDLLQHKGIGAYRIALYSDRIEGAVDDFLSGLDVLVINLPPGMRRDSAESYFDKMKLLHHHIKKNKLQNLVFVSSTSVYGNTQGIVTEETAVNPVTNSAIHLVKSEALFLDDGQLNTAVLRFGGLIGPQRHPVNFLSGRTGLKNGGDAVNLIHLDDCIHMIKSIITNEWWNEIFNGVYHDHPTKAEYYSREARARGLEIPHYESQEGETSGKIIESRNFLIKFQQFFTPIRS